MFRGYPFAEYDEFVTSGGEFKVLQIKEAIIESNLRPRIPSNCPAFYSLLIQRSWKHDSRKRIQLEVIIDTLAKELGIPRPPPTTHLVQLHETVELPSGILSFAQFGLNLWCGCKNGKVYVVDMKVVKLISDA